MMVIQRAMADAENDLFLARPELKAAPRATRAKDPAYTAALAAGFKKGQGQLLLIAANARYFTDSATQVPNDVGNGEAAAGTSIDFYGRVYEETVGPGRLRFVLPRAATAITPDPVAILRGAPHPELARQFVEFLLSPEAQRLWDLKAGMPGVLGVPTQRALRRMPIRRDVYGDSAAQRTDWSDPQVNPFIAAGGFNQRSEWMKPFTELQQIWAAEWIDSRDSLRQAYDAVRAVHNAQRRQQLLVELADVPIDMAQVDALVNQDKDVVNAKGDVDLWRAQMRIKLAKDFRDHYQAVEVRARASRSD
jgi:hypothetical protein